MKRVGVVLGVAAVMAVAACTSSSGGSAAPVSATSVADSATPSTAGSVPQSSPVQTSSSGPAPATSGDTVGGQVLAGLAVTKADLPAGFDKTKATVADALTEVSKVPAGATVTPPDCFGLSPINETSAAQGFFASYANAATREVLGEFLAPAGSPSLAQLRDTATRCAEATIEVPAKGTTVRSRLDLAPPPAVTADNVPAVRSMVTTTTAGSPEIPVSQTLYVAETKGTLVALTASGGPSGQPVDPGVVDGLFRTLVDRVTAGR